MAASIRAPDGYPAQSPNCPRRRSMTSRCPSNQSAPITPDPGNGQGASPALEGPCRLTHTIAGTSLRHGVAAHQGVLVDRSCLRSVERSYQLILGLFESGTIDAPASISPEIHRVPCQEQRRVVSERQALVTGPVAEVDEVVSRATKSHQRIGPTGADQGQPSRVGSGSEFDSDGWQGNRPHHRYRVICPTADRSRCCLNVQGVGEGEHGLEPDSQHAPMQCCTSGVSEFSRVENEVPNWRGTGGI